MVKKINSFLSIFILLSGVLSFQVSANDSVTFKSVATPLSFENMLGLTQANMLLAKKVGGYDESNDPALRRGTENWEEPQGSFFIVPAVVFGIIMLFLFFNRE